MDCPIGDKQFDPRLSFQYVPNATPYRDINDVLCSLAQGMQRILGDDLVGLYLTGSLSYGGFDEGRSDIDLVVALKNPASRDKIELVKQLHSATERQYEKWSKRIECSYVPLEMLPHVLPPITPRPYLNGGAFHPEATYGNEWLIDQYFLYHHGIAIIGPDFKTLVKPIRLADVQQASVRNLYTEWKPKMEDAAYLADSHRQSYVVLNLCRILHCVMCGDAVSKKVATSWVKQQHPNWKDLVEAADKWHCGMKMERQSEVIEFIRFVIARTEQRA